MDGKARYWRLLFDRVIIETPAFIPVGTYGTVKSLTTEEILNTGTKIILGNAFHLWLRPGTELSRCTMGYIILCNGPDPLPL